MKKNSAMTKMNGRTDNRGLTLVELIVTVAIISIFSGVVLTMVRFGSNVFTSVSANAQNQMTAREILEELENLVIDANWSVYYEDHQFSVCSVDRTVSESTETSGTAAETKTGVWNLVVWDEDGQTLTYTRKSGSVKEIAATPTPASGTVSSGITGGDSSDANSGGDLSSDSDSSQQDFSNAQSESAIVSSSGVVTEVEDQLLADNVTDFSVDLSRVESEQVLTFEITIETRGKKITTQKSVSMRNKVQVARPDVFAG